MTTPAPFKAKDRVIVNLGTTKAPEYYAGTVSKVNKAAGTVNVKFDDGETLPANNKVSKVGIVGLIKGTRTRASMIPADQLSRWLAAAPAKTELAKAMDTIAKLPRTQDEDNVGNMSFAAAVAALKATGFDPLPKGKGVTYKQLPGLAVCATLLPAGIQIEYAEGSTKDLLTYQSFQTATTKVELAKALVHVEEFAKHNQSLKPAPAKSTPRTFAGKASALLEDAGWIPGVQQPIAHFTRHIWTSVTGRAEVSRRNVTVFLNDEVFGLADSLEGVKELLVEVKAKGEKVGKALDKKVVTKPKRTRKTKDAAPADEFTPVQVADALKSKGFKGIGPAMVIRWTNGHMEHTLVEAIRQLLGAKTAALYDDMGPGFLYQALAFNLGLRTSNEYRGTLLNVPVPGDVPATTTTKAKAKRKTK